MKKSLNIHPLNKCIPLFIEQLNLNKRTMIRAKPSSSCFEWKGKFKPTFISKTYLGTIAFQNGITNVIIDDIGEADYGHIPHIFPNGSLCLYHKGEWAVYKDGFLPILCWIDEWLFHFEIWNSTGIWTGGGIDHDGVKENS